MRYSVCIIDNDIPAAGEQAQALKIKDSELLNTSNLQLLLAKETWSDDIIKTLITRLLDAKDADGISPKWEVYGFTNPSFYINTIDNGFFRSDLIIFDWEYPGAQVGTGTDSESLLKEILNRTFSLVFVFSKADKKDEITAILAKPEFLEFKERLKYLDKTVAGAEQTSALLTSAEQLYADNFSFRFASVLRKKAVQSTDKILSDMGRASLNDVKNHAVVGESGKKDLIDFLAERFRTSVAGKDIYDLVGQIPEQAQAGAPDEKLAAKIWSYRLYFQQDPGDDLVRRGDIVKITKAGEGDSFHMVLSADCDLGRFWKKNFGIINTVVLHPLENSNSILRGWLTLCAKPKTLSDGNFKSLLAPVGALPEGPFVLPFVPVGVAQKNFVAIPKEISSQRITLPAEFTDYSEKQKGNHPIRYAYWPDTERLCTISEPFLTPAVQHVLDVIGGNGVPDYPDHMSQILKKILADFSVPPVVAQPQAAPIAAAAAAPVVKAEGLIKTS